MISRFQESLSPDKIASIVGTPDADAISLLEDGLPINPVHFLDVYVATKDTLLTPGYSNLIRAIRMTEKDYQEALEFLRSCSSAHVCALDAYIRGQCLRKGGTNEHITESLEVLRHAADQLERESDSPHCGACEIDYIKDKLKAEILRGLGAAYRKDGKWEDSRMAFDKAVVVVRDNPHFSGKVKADVFYSYGYLEYEWAYRNRHSHHEESVRRLQHARELLNDSYEFRERRWGCPWCRLSIVRLLLDRIDEDDVRDDIMNGFLTARRLENAIGDTEALLTAAVSGFAALALNLQSAHTKDFEFSAAGVYSKLQKLYKTRVVPKGARNCHAFDIEVIFKAIYKEKDQTGNIQLDKTRALINQSREWQVETLDAQQKLLAQFEADW